MWLWRKRSPFEKLDLPKKVFISHSYIDAEARERLLALLSKGVEPFIFPPITVPPEQMISDKLLDAIRHCDGLIYLQGGASAESFWVALERDYALRAGKRVFSFAPGGAALTPDTSPPLHLPIFPTWGAGDMRRVMRMLKFMRNKRFFDPFDLNKLRQIVKNDVAVNDELIDKYYGVISNGGYGVFFWSKKAEESEWFSGDAQIVAVDRRPVMDRLVIALLDSTNPAILSQQLGWRFTDFVQLYGDAQRSEMQRLDDLIVRLYWLIYRNTRQNQLS